MPLPRAGLWALAGHPGRAWEDLEAQHWSPGSNGKPTFPCSPACEMPQATTDPENAATWYRPNYTCRVPWLTAKKGARRCRVICRRWLAFEANHFMYTRSDSPHPKHMQTLDERPGACSHTRSPPRAHARRCRCPPSPHLPLPPSRACRRRASPAPRHRNKGPLSCFA